MCCVRTSLMAALGWLFLLPSLAGAQSHATGADVVGTVRDESQAVIQNALIVAKHLATNVERSTRSDLSGRFSVPLLPPGNYEVRIESAGFAAQTRTLTMTVGAVVQLDVTLTIAPTTVSVSVIGEHPVVNTRQTAIASLVTDAQVQRLPIDVRNFMSFATITPGVTSDRTPQQGASATSGLTFAGQRARANNVTVDGFDNNDAAAGGVRAVFSQDAVREFQVLVNSFPAEFGNASGGVVNIVTKSGTNLVTGNAFLFFRDEALNAKSHFERVTPLGQPIDLPKAPYTHTQFGATIGGPIRRNRTFHFVTYERLDVSASNLVTIDDQTEVRHPFLGTILGTPAEILRDAGFVVETGDVGYRRTIDQLSAKVDHHFNPRQTLAIRFHAVDTLDENVEPFGGITARSRAAALDATDYALALGATTVLSPRWLNDLRFQAAYRDQIVRSLDPACGGPCVEPNQGGPTLEVTGVASVGRQRFTPQNRRSLTYQLLNSASYYRGSHTVKFGGELVVRDNRATGSVLPLHFGGRYIFAALPAIPGVLPAAVSSIQAVALGLPAAYVQGYGSDRAQLDGRDAAAFLQDDWRVTPRLTLRYGLRYQYQQWASVEHHVNGYPTPYPFPKDRDNIAPRVAVAWDATRDGKTLVHGAYGVFYDNQLRSLQSVAVLIDGTDHVRTLTARFPNPLVRTAWNSVGRRLPESQSGSFPSLQFAVDPGLKTAFAHQASAGVDRELAVGARLSASAVYARGHNQVGTIDYNPIVPSLGANRRPLDVNGVAGTSASVLQYTSFGETWYRGLVLAFDRRYRDRYQINTSYTWSKAEDTSTDFQSAFMPQQNGRGRDPQNLAGLPIGFDPRSERGPSTQDQRHRLVLSGFWSGPRGIGVSGIATFASGRPYTILAGADLNGDGDGGAFPSDRARRDPADEASSVGRNSGRMPSQAIVDLRLSKVTPIGRARVEVLIEAFNVFNRDNFFESSNTSSTFIFGAGRYPDAPLPTFGRYTQTLPPRQVQLGLKFQF
jgi:carboxypeptidase family protein/TonB-dependent receptor-like protein